MPECNTSYKSAHDSAPVFPWSPMFAQCAGETGRWRYNQSRKRKDWRAVPTPYWLAKYGAQRLGLGSPDNYPEEASDLLHSQTPQKMTRSCVLICGGRWSSLERVPRFHV